MTNRFEYTRAGYIEAMSYLDGTDQTHLIEKEQSVDGFTVVALANSLYNKQMNTSGLNDE